MGESHGGGSGRGWGQKVGPEMEGAGSVRKKRRRRPRRAGHAAGTGSDWLERESAQKRNKE